MSHPGRFDPRQTFYRLGAYLLLHRSEPTDASRRTTALLEAQKALLAGAPQGPPRAYHRDLYAVVHVGDKLAAMDSGLKVGQLSKALLLVPAKLDGKGPLDLAFRICAGAAVTPAGPSSRRPSVETVAARMRAAVIKIRDATEHLPRVRGLAAAHVAMSGRPDPLSEIDAALETIEQAVSRFPEAPSWKADLPSHVTELLNAAQLEWFDIAVITERGTNPGASAIERRKAIDRVRDLLELKRHWGKKALAAAHRTPMPKASSKRTSQK